MLINFTNHPFETWSDDQKNAAISKYAIVEDMAFPHINPVADELDLKAEAIKYVELILSKKPAAVHIMGEMNFTFQMVHFLMEEGIECIASTTKRYVEDFPDGSQRSQFKFVKFRSYNFFDNSLIRTNEIVLSDEQQSAYDLLKNFIQKENDSNVFILKGYAGTGKTTLLKYFIEECCKEKKTVTLMASTGRAAAVLKSKAKFNAKTVHSIVYKFDEVKATSDDAWSIRGGETGQLYLNFAPCVISKDDISDVYIIDEASMISGFDSTSINSTKFGSGNLLKDLLDVIGTAKVVFVGDPCQLPPVDEASLSAALSKSIIEQKYLKKVSEFELCQIQRQAENSEILKIATPLREQIVNENIPEWPKLTLSRYYRDVKIHQTKEELIRQYLIAFKTFGSGNTILITHSNGEAFSNNQTVRADLFPDKAELQPGDILMVIKNCLSTGLRNGDQVIIMETGERERRAKQTFLKVKLKDINSGMVYTTYIIETLLNKSDAGLSADENRDIIIDFDTRMKERNIKRNTIEYKGKMKADVYLNALHVKYGYAITLQKAQGGEWRHVFLNITSSIYVSKFNGQPQNMLKWFYTAITRTQKYLNLTAGSWLRFKN